MMMPAPTPDEILTKTELSVAAADAAPVLGERAEVGVVLDVRPAPRSTSLAACARVDTHASRGRSPGVRITSSVTGAGRPIPMCRSALQPGRHRVDELGGQLPSACVVLERGRQVASLLGEDLSREVADGDGEVAVPEVDAGDHACRGGQADGRATPAAAGLAVDQPGGEELPNDVGDGGPGQAGLARQLGLGERRGAAFGVGIVRAGRSRPEYVEHPLLVGGPQGRGGARSGVTRHGRHGRTVHGRPLCGQETITRTSELQ